MYDLRRLRAFHAVAETGSFSTAAHELWYAQSVVSHHVAALERELGVTLVNRGTRPVTVTDAGARLLRHTAAVLGHVAAAEDELRRLRSGELDVGVVWREWQPSERRGEGGDEGFEHVELAADHYRVVLPLTHRLAHRRDLRLRE